MRKMLRATPKVSFKAKADDAFDAIVSESDPKLRKWMAMVMKKETEVAMAHPKYPSKTPTARPCKAKADDAFDAIVSESDPKLRKWMAMVMKKETEVAMAQKETEVAMAQKEMQKEMENGAKRDGGGAGKDGTTAESAGP